MVISQKKDELVNIMKPERCKYSKASVFSRFLLGLIWFTLLVFTLNGDPLIIALKYYTRVTNGSFVHELMLQEMEGIHISAYLFNVTNAQEFMNGTDDKLKVQEVGPFTYKEMRRNLDVEIDEKAELVRYTPDIRLELVLEESIGKPEDFNITAPNIPMLGMTSKMSEYPIFTRYGFNQLTALLDSKPIVTLDVHSYLWGYHEPLVSLGHTFLPGSVHFDKMGIMDRIYDPETRNRIEISVADDDKFMIKRINGHKKLNMGESGNPDSCALCNTLENAYEGVGFQPDMAPDFPIRIFRNGICRILDLEVNGTKPTEYGGKAMVYHFNDNFYNSLEPNKTSNGILVMPDCFFGVPLAFSRPHFLGSDPSVYKRIDGIKPDAEKFKAWVSIDPKIGMALETVFSIQLNLVVADVSSNAQAKSFSNMVLPICYVRIEQPPLPEESNRILTGVYGVGPRIVLGAQILFAFLVIISWGYFARAVYCNYKEKGTTMSFPMETPIKEINANNIEESLTPDSHKIEQC